MNNLRIYLMLLLVFVLPGVSALAAGTTPPMTRTEQLAQLHSIHDQAVQRVKDIVNQPITHLPRTSWSSVQTYPSWFHDGATKPDFNKVDIRATQEMSYDRFEHVTSKLNPREMFVGKELEFNSMTKYFYTDRNLPKKKLTEAEMLEINRLYRIIGASETKIAALENTSIFADFSPIEFFNSPYGTVLSLVLLSGVGFVLYRKMFA